MKKSFMFIVILSLIAILPLVSAQWYGGWYSGSQNISDLLDNEWVIFIILFAIFTTTIYSSLGKVFKENKSVPIIIALALSFLVTAGIQRQWTFLEKPIMYWALILTLILVVLTFFRAMQIGPAGLIGLILLVVGLWPTIRNSLTIEGVATLPYGLIRFLDAISSVAWILLIIGFGLVIYAWFKTISAPRQRYYGG